MFRDVPEYTMFQHLSTAIFLETNQFFRYHDYFRFFFSLKVKLTRLAGRLYRTLFKYPNTFNSIKTLWKHCLVYKQWKLFSNLDWFFSVGLFFFSQFSFLHVFLTKSPRKLVPWNKEKNLTDREKLVSRVYWLKRPCS